jgi:RNA polymerase sigma-70 factor (ECF subfamily)
MPPDPTLPADSALVREARGGAQAAFCALIERHFATVHAIALARLGDRDRAEDLAQDVFLRAFLHLDHLSDPERFGPWVGQIARNLALDWLRVSRRRSELVPMVSLDESSAASGSGAAEVREQMDAEQRHRAVHEAIARLPLEQREVVLLHCIEGLNQSEVARQLGLSPPTVGRRLRRALRAMRGMLEPLLREAAPGLRARPAAVSRAGSLILAAAALPVATRAAVAAAGPVASTGQAAGGGVLGTLAAVAAHGGKFMATGKGIAATIVAAAAIAVGVHEMSPGQAEPRVIPASEAGPVALRLQLNRGVSWSETVALLASSEIDDPHHLQSGGVIQVRLGADCRVRDVSPDGQAQVERTVRETHVEILEPSGAQPDDAWTHVQGQTTTVTMNPLGEIGGAAQTLPSDDEAKISLIFGEMLTLCERVSSQFPERDVRPGDTWTATVPMPVVMWPMALSSTFERMEDVGGRRRAVIDRTLTWSSPVSFEVGSMVNEGNGSRVVQSLGDLGLEMRWRDLFWIDEGRRDRSTGTATLSGTITSRQTIQGQTEEVQFPDVIQIAVDCAVE